MGRATRTLLAGLATFTLGVAACASTAPGQIGVTAPDAGASAIASPGGTDRTSGRTVPDPHAVEPSRQPGPPPGSVAASDTTPELAPTTTVLGTTLLVRESTAVAPRRLVSS